MQYDPGNKNHRESLAQSVISKLNECGFEEVDNPGGERVFQIGVKGKPNTKVMVYTTVVGNTVRSVGKDAIRISGVYTNSQGKSLGLVRQKRVYRTGEIDEIVDRMYRRMREAYKRVMSNSVCRDCGSPKFLSSKGNEVCSEFCWTKR